MNRRIKNYAGRVIVSRESLYLEVGHGVLGSFHLPPTSADSRTYTEALDHASEALSRPDDPHPQTTWLPCSSGAIGTVRRPSFPRPASLSEPRA